ncbi:MAG: ArnT family glycosyltransferase [Gammaproteobacteria bacterium]
MFRYHSGNTLWLIALWTILIGVSLSSRPLFPIDETRYVSVAWEMWLRGDFLVPYLNGEPYSHKPPLLFWMMQIGWLLFGVNDWTPRLVAPLFGLGAVLLVGRVASMLWPEGEKTARIAPFLLLGCGFWAVFGTLTMFDVPLAFFVLLGIYGLLTVMHSGQSLKQWTWVGVAVGGGVLIKGPVILLHVLPAALLAPLWWDNQYGAPRWSAWYLGVLAAVLMGAAIALCWAVPAGIAGGEAYRNAIFWGQTSGRMVQSFAHRLPWWWYLKSLPLLLLPWLLWTPFWSALQQLRWEDRGVRFCLAWVLPVFTAFSLISGKRLHYLLPLFPALALLLARAASGLAENKWCSAHLPVEILVAVVGLALALFPLLNRQYQWYSEFLAVSPLWGIVLAAIALGSCILLVKNAVQSSLQTCTLCIAALVSISGAYFSAMRSSYDLQPAAQQIAVFLERHQQVAYLGKYHGQFNFLGRIEQSLPVLMTPAELSQWLQAHPSGYVVATYKDHAKRLDPLTDYRYTFKNRQLALFASRVLLQQPAVQRLLQ